MSSLTKTYCIAMAYLIVALIASGVVAITIGLLVMGVIFDTSFVIMGIVSVLLAFGAGDRAIRKFVLAEQS